MTRHSLIVQAVMGILFYAALPATAQTPAPPAPQLTKEQKEAAAAVEAPKAPVPPPVPGQLQGGPPKTAAPAPAPQEVPAASSASKMQALEAVTRQPAAQGAPRVGSPADKMPVTSSTSASRQFIVHGKVFETRSAMSSRCDEISQELRKVLNDKEPFVLPIVVVLNTGAEAGKSKGPPVSTAISELTHGGFHLQVTVNERPGLNAEDLRKEVVRALLAERILRNHQKITAPQHRLLLPDWVMTGVLQAMNHKSGTRSSVTFSTIFRSGKIYGIEEIITASPVEMDGLSRSIYETSCGALVLALADQPDGPSHFNKFLNALASDPRSERDLLNAAFPNFAATASSLNKWWSLQLATLSKPGIDEPLTPAESLKAIEDAITIRYEVPPADVPKNVKPRPFVLPAPLPVVPAHETAPERTAAAGEIQKPKTKAITDADAETGGLDGKPRRSLWRRLLFLGDPAEEKPENAENSPEEDKPGFFGRIFGLGADEKKEADASRADTAEKNKKEDKDKPQAGDEEEKPSMLNPLNWFRGGKEEKKDDAENEAKEGARTSALSPGSFDITRMISPMLADAWQMIAPAAPRLTAQPLFDFRKRKSPPEEEKKKTEEQEKAAAKKTDKPRTTNPNARPASKTATTQPGKPKVTNPHARPVPAGMPPPVAGAAATAKPGLVPVALPLEEYQHILKHPDRVKILARNITALHALELRVSVLFRPVISAYLAVVTDLQEGRTKDMPRRLATLREFALVAHQKSVAVRDYLDWFEASESGRLSGKFDDYLNLPEIIKKELPARTDPISKYLDAIDQEFSK